MSVFKCKMCGGTVEFEQGATVGVCDSCGTKQPLPPLDDEKRANLYDRANHFRRNNEYDKAAGIYEQILSEDSADAEAYWSLVLCRYGIEYVEDPATHKRIPTVNRAQYTSIFADEDYKSALEYADGYQREIYEQEARAIDEIQRGILAISQKEEPFDVFICYKETDNSGRRTPDSVLANDLYHQLTQEGFKVFFARITLEDKLGSAYEPYIFAALNSSKVMVVLGTKPEYFNAVWVKNEWSRYLALIKNGAKKMLIPAYRDMDPYDLPEEFSHLQAQDMSKLGFMQDLIRGIKKIVDIDEPKVIRETVISGSNATTAPLLKRAFMFLEDESWQEANEYCEKVLDLDPENAQAYLGKLLADLHIRTRAGLKECAVPFEENSNCQKAMRFGDEGLREELKECISLVDYNSAVNAMKSANSEEAYKEIADRFESMSNFKDAPALAQECLKHADECRKDEIYNSIYKITEDTHYSWQNDADKYQAAIEKLESLNGWRDSEERILRCKKILDEIDAEKEKARIAAEKEQLRVKHMRKIMYIAGLSILAVILLIVLLTQIIIPQIKNIQETNALRAVYKEAKNLYDSGEYEEAAKLFSTIDYKDSNDMVSECFFIHQQDQLSKLNSISVGDRICFGFYEQDNIAADGKEQIEWRVLDIDENKALIISEYALDCKQYNFSGLTYGKVTTWENCTLRTFLNDIFYNQAFGAKHQEMIVSSTVSADSNPSYGVNPGNDTTDKIFLLSIAEAEKYFAERKFRSCRPTAFAVRNGGYNVDNYCWWWLRSPGSYQYYASSVNSDGSIYYIGNDCNTSAGCVRPAMWIELEP